MKLICLISHPRSGSTSLMKKIEQETNTAAVLEIFHTNEQVICQHLDEGLGKGAAAHLKEALGIREIRGFALENPIEYLKYIRDVALKNNKEAVIFKIFPGHIRIEEKLGSVLFFSDLLLILRRNTLHSYISNKKAIKVGTYANVDTSDLKIRFDSQEFLNWRNVIYSFFGLVSELSLRSEQDIFSFNYEELYSENLSHMNGFLDCLGLKRNMKQTNKVILRKQDNKVLASHKVINDIEMMSFLSQEKLESLDSVRNSDMCN